MKETEQKLYECPECHLKYKDKEWADKCEAWCKKYKSCNLDIIEHAQIRSERTIQVRATTPLYAWHISRGSAGSKSELFGIMTTKTEKYGFGGQHRIRTCDLCDVSAAL